MGNVNGGHAQHKLRYLQLPIPQGTRNVPTVAVRRLGGLQVTTTLTSVVKIDADLSIHNNIHMKCTKVGLKI
jgi:hypothetical protein